LTVIACIFFEWVIQKYLIKGPITIFDGSALVTGILLAFNVPSNLPAWMIVIGALVAIGMAKMSFGGLGKNIFNPALVARVFLLISFPVQMTSWPKPSPITDGLTDVITGPTPLGIVKEGLAADKTMSELKTEIPSYMQDFVGNMGGSIGEVSALALILGGIYMLWKKIITWHIPISMLATVVIFSAIFWGIDPEHYADPVFHLLTGGMLLGAIFMATDMVSSPMTNGGQLLFGFGVGLLTILIRMWGAYPEGVSFAILLMNAVVPLINKGFKPKRFGIKPAVAIKS
jgi:electron transport complex protein RnfD